MGKQVKEKDIKESIIDLISLIIINSLGKKDVKEISFKFKIKNYFFFNDEISKDTLKLDISEDDFVYVKAKSKKDFDYEIITDYSVDLLYDILYEEFKSLSLKETLSLLEKVQSKIK